jgi:hypothetical protein
MTESLNIYDLLSHIENEGGLHALLAWGLDEIDNYDVPDDLKEAWDDLNMVFTDFDKECERVYRLLNKYERIYDENKEF